MQRQQISCRNSGSVEGGAECSSVIKKSLGKQCSFFVFWCAPAEANKASSRLCSRSVLFPGLCRWGIPAGRSLLDSFYNEFNRKAVELVWTSRRAFWRCSRTPHLIQQIVVWGSGCFTPNMGLHLQVGNKVSVKMQRNVSFYFGPLWDVFCLSIKTHLRVGKWDGWVAILVVMSHVRKAEIL